MIGNATTDGKWELTHSYDRRTERPSEVVTLAVAGLTDRDLLGIEPLYSAVDPDALDSFVDGVAEGSTASLSFDYDGCRVYVDADTVAVERVSRNEAR